jgi:vacuolar-type H+-ATPase subunit D/Vma8
VRSRKVSIETENTLNDKVLSLQREIRELKKTNRNLEIDARIAMRNSQEHMKNSKFYSVNSSFKLTPQDSDREEVQLLQKQIADLNHKIFQMKNEFDEERSLA